jgi:hypothetical protein
MVLRMHILSYQPFVKSRCSLLRVCLGMRYIIAMSRSSTTTLFIPSTGNQLSNSGPIFTMFLYRFRQLLRLLLDSFSAEVYPCSRW